RSAKPRGSLPVRRPRRQASHVGRQFRRVAWHSLHGSAASRPHTPRKVSLLGEDVRACLYRAVPLPRAHQAVAHSRFPPLNCSFPHGGKKLIECLVLGTVRRKSASSSSVSARYAFTTHAIYFMFDNNIFMCQWCGRCGGGPA